MQGFLKIIHSQIWWLLWIGQVANDFPLPPRRHITLAVERRLHAFMPQVLAPCLELFLCLTDPLP
jgi:hypothetical protein